MLLSQVRYFAKAAAVPKAGATTAAKAVTAAATTASTPSTSATTKAKKPVTPRGSVSYPFIVTII